MEAVYQEWLRAKIRSQGFQEWIMAQGKQPQKLPFIFLALPEAKFDVTQEELEKHPTEEITEPNQLTAEELKEDKSQTPWVTWTLHFGFILFRRIPGARVFFQVR